jgi:Zn-dependent protease
VSYDPYQHDQYRPRDVEPDYDYSPIKQRRSIADVLRRLWAPIVAGGLLLLKFGGFAVKFFGIFLAVGGYALIWGWRFAVGFVLLILVHEAGHYLEAKRQGLNPSLPVFIPFLGAYVAMQKAPFDPWRNLLVSAAGPVLGGLGALALLLAGEANDSRLLVALAYSGFMLNLFNLLPFKPLDGGFIWQSVKALRYGYRERASWSSSARVVLGTGLYFGLAAALAFGMLAAHVPQDRL